jgi:tetratricopeptide (TPR) repeat protein
MMRRFAILCASIGVLFASTAHAATRWMRLTSPHFELYTTAGEKQGTDTLRFYEQIREFFRVASPIDGDNTSILRIIQFEDPAEYQRFRMNQAAVAYFLAGPEREYIVLGDRAMKDPHAAIHEYLHVIVRHSGLKLPLWLNEGWAEVFASLRPMGKEMAVGDLLPDRVKTLTREKWFDFDTLVSVDRTSPLYNEDARAGTFYAESWALVHMLFLSPDYKDNFGKMVMALHNGKSAAESMQSAFGRSSTQVFADLHSYLDRKKLFGTIFSIAPDRQQWPIHGEALSDFDTRMMKAELLWASGRRGEAAAEYTSLEREQPGQVELLRTLGNLALREKNNAQARAYFRKAFDAGDKDARMCYELAKLERDAGANSATLAPLLDRALESKPDFPEAEAMRGVIKVEARDWPGALTMLSGLRSVSEQDASSVYCALALSQIELGDIPDALQNLESCQGHSKSSGEIARAQRVAKFIQARALPNAAVHFGEKQTTVTGMLQGVDCSAQGNRIVVSLGQKIALFDLPVEDAIEMPAKPVENVRFQCGAMKPIRIAVEFAPPRSAIETSAGIVRRLIF